MSSPNYGYRNYPLSIEDFPPEVTVKEQYLKPADREIGRVKHAPLLEFVLRPAVEQDIPTDGILGLSQAVERALLQARLCYYVRATEILIDLDLAGTELEREEVISILSEIMGKSGAMCAFEELSGRPSNRQKSKKAYKEAIAWRRRRFQEYCVNIAHLNTSTTDRIIFTQNSDDRVVVRSSGDEEPVFFYPGNARHVSARGRKGEGRPRSAKVWILSEDELVERLIGSGLLSRLDDPELHEYHLKPLEVVASSSKYKSFVLAQRVGRGGKGQYSRAELADGIVSISTARKMLESTGIRVTRNPPIRKPIRADEIDRLPKDDAEYDHAVAMKCIPAGTHIRDMHGRSFAFTQIGARAALLGSKQIFRANYARSTYDPGHKGPRTATSALRLPNEVVAVQAYERTEQPIFAHSSKLENRTYSPGTWHNPHGTTLHHAASLMCPGWSSTEPCGKEDGVDRKHDSEGYADLCLKEFFMASSIHLDIGHMQITQFPRWQARVAPRQLCGRPRSDLDLWQVIHASGNH